MIMYYLIFPYTALNMVQLVGKEEKFKGKNAKHKNEPKIPRNDKKSLAKSCRVISIHNRKELWPQFCLKTVLNGIFAITLKS